MPTSSRPDNQGTTRPQARPRHAGGAASAPARKRRPAGATAELRPASARRAPSSAARTHARGGAKGAVGLKSAASARPRTARARRSGGMPVWAVVLVAVVVIGLSVGGFFLMRSLLGPSSQVSAGSDVPDGQEVTVVIPEGSSGTAIVSILMEKGVIRSERDFKAAVQQQNADQSLRCGTYSFVTGSDPANVVRQLVEGPNSKEGQLTLPEGLTLTQTANLVEESLGIPQDDFLAQAKASNYADEYEFLEDAGNDSLEGFLYPKTYDLADKEATADTVIRLMLSQYAAETASLDYDGARQQILSRYALTASDYDFLKIASIIEKEALNEDDRSKVSSVFYNRLSQGMKLQSDATMMYETGGAVSAQDLATDSPYNTYLYGGLPPTPICSPSQWALEAALNPADTSYYYFFIIEEGNYSNHTFSETFEEHDKAYAAALAEQKAQAGADSGEDADA